MSVDSRLHRPTSPHTSASINHCFLLLLPTPHPSHWEEQEWETNGPNGKWGTERSVCVWVCVFICWRDTNQKRERECVWEWGKSLWYHPAPFPRPIQKVRSVTLLSQHATELSSCWHWLLRQIDNTGEAQSHVSSAHFEAWQMLNNCSFVQIQRMISRVSTRL